jgi:PadR family transcriptional regulator PadR
MGGAGLRAGPFFDLTVTIHGLDAGPYLFRSSEEIGELATMQLTSLDQKVMLAVINLHPHAYGVSIQDHIRERTGEKPPAIGSLYAAIERLEERGFVRTQLGDPTKARGGRAKLYVIITARGQAALRQSLQALASLQGRTLLGTKAAPRGVPV